MRSLTEDQYWQAVFPAYDATNHTLAVDALLCTGAKGFDDPVYAGGTTRGTPITVQAEDIVLGNGGDHVRIAWLRTHRWPDGSEAGPLALVRAKEAYAEVYAIGAYRRSVGQPVFQVERLGTEVLLSATSDGCHGQPATAPCEKNIDLFLPKFGKLERLVTISTLKRAYAAGSEPGIGGQIEYELTASPQYTADGIHVFEQVQAKDSVGRVVHKTELERTFLLHDGTLDQDGDSLWARVYPSAAPSASSSAAGSAAAAAAAAPTTTAAPKSAPAPTKQP
jgi:hypothetical protein